MKHYIYILKWLDDIIIHGEKSERWFKQDLLQPLMQDWHSDGDHQSDSDHLPAYAVNVFVPLVDLTPLHGPTE